MSNLLLSIRARISNFLVREDGQDLVEYALWSGLIALGLIAIGVTAYLTIGNNIVDGISACVDFDGTTTCGPLG